LITVPLYHRVPDLSQSTSQMKSLNGIAALPKMMHSLRSSIGRNKLMYVRDTHIRRLKTENIVFKPPIFKIVGPDRIQCW